MANNALNDELFYFNIRLQKKLQQIPKYPLSVIKAPSGFGKTTAVREYLRNNMPSGAQSHWYTCLGEPPQKAWCSICKLFGKVDPSLEKNLLKLGFPNRENLAELVSVLQTSACQLETYLVIDNFQGLEANHPRVIDALSFHGRPQLHIIIITQQLGTDEKMFVHNDRILMIDNPFFIFDSESVVRYFRLLGLRLSANEAVEVELMCGGWAAAIRLQAQNFKTTGSLSAEAGINQLVESAIWMFLSPIEQNFLLSVSLLDGFSIQQAQIIMNLKQLPKVISTLLSSNAFIRYLPEKKSYEIHSILRDYLRERFCEKPRDWQQEVFLLAGQACEDVSDYYPALQLYLKINDFEAILALLLRDDYINYQNERYLIAPLSSFLDKCPPEVLCKHPRSMVILAFQLFFFGQYEKFGYLCGLIGNFLADPPSCSETETRKIAGEMEYIKSFIAYNDIEQMSSHHRKAYELLNGPSSFHFLDSPWTFGGVSVVYMFWRASGTLKQSIKELESCLPYYLLLSRGHGSGADSLMRAEALLMAGLDDDAEALCHKTIYLARNKNQTSICLAAELTLAKIAILNGSAELYQKAIERIINYAENNSDWQTSVMTSLCQATLDLSLGRMGNIAPWLLELEAPGQNLFAVVAPYCHILYGKVLLLSKRHNELFGISKLVLELAEKTNSLLPQVYHYIHLALAKESRGQSKSANSYLQRALNLALPDQVYLPFAEHYAGIEPLLERVLGSEHEKDKMRELLILIRRQRSGVAIISKTLGSRPSDLLSPREKEIAHLAQEGLSVKQIASKLFISPETVKSSLKSIYNKLNISSKLQLSKIDL